MFLLMFIGWIGFGVSLYFVVVMSFVFLVMMLVLGQFLVVLLEVVVLGIVWNWMLFLGVIGCVGLEFIDFDDDGVFEFLVIFGDFNFFYWFYWEWLGQLFFLVYSLLILLLGVVVVYFVEMDGDLECEIILVEVGCV